MQVSAEVISEASDADLIILEGMGRAIESNLYAQFTVDSLKLGMIKHKEVRTSRVTVYFLPLCMPEKIVAESFLCMCTSSQIPSVQKSSCARHL